MESEKDKNGPELVAYLHTGPSVYTPWINFSTIKIVWNMSTICGLYFAKVEKETKQTSLWLQITVQITTPTATKIWGSMHKFGKSLVYLISYEPYRTSMVSLEQQPQLRSSSKEDGTPTCMDRSLSKEEQKTQNI